MTTTTKTTTKLKTPVGTNTSAGGSKKDEVEIRPDKPKENHPMVIPPRGRLTLEVIVPALDVHAFPQLDSPVVGELHQGDRVEGQDLYAPLEMWVKIGKERWAPVYLGGDRKLQV